ncbi:MAG: putative toxin-antitoxin system toxin component, PIN family [Fusobacteriaceae bacterium]|nr:putative toxin-antitoxin system toxin component, PIN family [Fusobacteriaceae bacterium]
MNCDIVLDTNVLVSALLTKTGKPAQIIRMVSNERLKVLYSSAIFAEYVRVLRKPKLKIPNEWITELLNIFEILGKAINPPKSILPMKHEPDRVFYDTAVAANAILVTGNLKHFPPKEFIMSPADFLKMMHETEESFGAID